MIGDDTFGFVAFVDDSHRGLKPEPALRWRLQAIANEARTSGFKHFKKKKTLFKNLKINKLEGRVKNVITFFVSVGKIFQIVRMNQIIAAELRELRFTVAH